MIDILELVFDVVVKTFVFIMAIFVGLPCLLIIFAGVIKILLELCIKLGTKVTNKMWSNKEGEEDND